jgi:azurin
MKLPLPIFVCSAGLIGLAAAQADSNLQSVKNVTITASDNLHFNIESIVVQPGQTVHVVLKNQGTFPRSAMGHNWVLLKAGIDPTAYAVSAAAAPSEEYQPKTLAAETLATIPLLGAKETGEITFTAPSQPGKYGFLCSFPGHCQIGMRGVLVVK